jgi:hypothetical protein
MILKRNSVKLFGSLPTIDIQNQCTVSRFIIDIRKYLKIILESELEENTINTEILKIRRITATIGNILMTRNNLEKSGCLLEALNFTPAEFCMVVDYLLDEMNEKSANLNFLAFNIGIIDSLALHFKEVNLPN